jgi:hypothetical protein
MVLLAFMLVTTGTGGAAGPAGILGWVLLGAGMVAGIIWIVNRKKLDQIKTDAKVKHKPHGVAGSRWTCSKCSETNEPQFDSCWKCGTLKKDDRTD